MEHRNNKIYLFLTVNFFSDKSQYYFIIQLRVCRYLDLTFFICFTVEQSAGPVISAFGVNGVFSCLDLNIHNVGKQLIRLRFDLPPGKVRRRWSSERLGDSYTQAKVSCLV